MKLSVCGNAGNPCCATAVYIAALCELATEGQREYDREGDPALLLAVAREADAFRPPVNASTADRRERV